MKYLAPILSILAAALVTASGQSPVLPAQRSTGVTVNGNGTVVAPANFWDALSDAQANALLARVELVRNHPVFLIPMGEPYVDFVIKGSVTNFQGEDSMDHLVYWFASASDLSMRGNAIFDNAATIFVCSGQSGRSWLQARTWQSLFEQFGPGRTFNSVVFCPSKILGSANWMFAGNRQLTWSYARVSPVDFERDANGDVVWNPILPVAWRQAPPDPPTAAWPLE